MVLLEVVLDLLAAVAEPLLLPVLKNLPPGAPKPPPGPPKLPPGPPKPRKTYPFNTETPSKRLFNKTNKLF